MKRRYQLQAGSWAVLIMILCGLPGKKLPKLSFLEWAKPDKIVHLVLFGVMSFLLLKLFFADKEKRTTRYKFIAVSASVVYGVLIEILQATIFIDRTGDYRDALADALGAFIGLWIFNYLVKKQSSRIN